MEKTWWSITSEYMGWTKEEFLFTYDEWEKQQNEVNKNNAWLVQRADFYPVYTQFLFLDVNATELMILSYLYYWTKNWGWIYTKNEDLAFISKASVSTVTRALKELVKNWYINVDEKKLRMWTDRKMQVTTALVNLMSGKISINNWVKIKNIEEFLISTRQFDESYNNNNKKNKNNIPNGKTKSFSLNKNLNDRLTNICMGDLTFSDNVIERLEEYNHTRSKKLEKLTDKWFKLVIDKLVKYWKWTEEWMIAVLKQSIENGWEWLFEVKGLKPKVDYENDLWLFLNKMKTNYEWLKQELGKEKFFELKKKALEYWAENKLL